MNEHGEAIEAGDPPWNLHAEQYVLGAILLDASRAMREVANDLKAEHFYRESHRNMYSAMLSLDQANDPIDVVTVSERMHEAGDADPGRSIAELSELASSVPTVANIGHWARIVRDKYQLRSVIAFAQETLVTARGSVEDVSALVDEMSQKALRLSNSGNRASVVQLRDVLRTALERVEQLSKSTKRGGVTGVPTGFYALDGMTSGFQPGDLVILAARPGMGKTALALNWLVNAAKDRRNPTPGIIFSLEMSAEQLATRLWCAESRVPMERVKTGDLGDPDWRQLFDGIKLLSKLNIFIDDTAQIGVAEMLRKCRQLKHDHALGMVIVDYLQLMGGGGQSRNTNREQIISEISRNLKGLARELELPVIALSQLNRGVESRTDKRPMLSDLRESGAIEQDADIITFVYRDSYYQQMKGKNAPGEEDMGGFDAADMDDSFDPAAPSETELIIAKHRSGSTGTVRLLFHPPLTLFTNLESEDAPPPPDDTDVPGYMKEDAFDYEPPPPEPESSGFEPGGFSDEPSFAEPAGFDSPPPFGGPPPFDDEPPDFDSPPPFDDDALPDFGDPDEDPDLPL